MTSVCLNWTEAVAVVISPDSDCTVCPIEFLDCFHVIVLEHPIVPVVHLIVDYVFAIVVFFSLERRMHFWKPEWYLAHCIS